MINDHVFVLFSTKQYHNKYKILYILEFLFTINETMKTIQIRAKNEKRNTMKSGKFN